MSEPMIKPDPADRSYVTVKDKRTGKAQGITVYGLRPAEVIEAINIGVEELKKRRGVAA